MNKSQGATIGTVLLAALLVRGAGSGVPGFTAASDASGAGTVARGNQSFGEGPWVASCEYWAPEKMAAEIDSSEFPPLEISIGNKDQQLKGTLRASKTKEESACAGSDLKGKWGLPDSSPSSRLKITTIIATVPDPVHTNMALQFDRAMDALIDGAEDNGYLGSYYWLPWQVKQEKSKEAEGAGTARSQAELEQEPGLIIFKPLPSKDPSAPYDFRSALYLFLVGETPTSGINGYQIQKAFRYEDDLKAAGAEVVRSVKNAPNELAIIGPTFSGSAASLRRAIDLELRKPEEASTLVRARGTTSTVWAVEQMNGGATKAPATSAGNASLAAASGPKVDYASFANNIKFDESKLADVIFRSGVDHARVAMLVEDGTTLGEASSRQAGDKEGFVVIRFPREISMLRNAETEHESKGSAAGQSEAAPSPYLHLSLKDSNNYDSVPHLSRAITPLSQEAQLMTIARQLQRYRSDYIAIAATNVLDQLFLAQFLHRAVPDARLVFYGGDLLFERDVDDVPFIGAITIGPYDMVDLSNSPGPGHEERPFPDWATEAYYNAASFTFWDGKQWPKLAGYRNGTPDSREGAGPPLWVTVIGSDGYYPLGLANKTAADPDVSQILPAIPLSAGNSASRKDNSAAARDGKSTGSVKLPIHASRAWHFLCLFVFLLCVAHTSIICVADYWSPATRDLAFLQNDQPHRRAMYVHIGTVMLFCMAFVVTWPLIPTLHIIEIDAASGLAGIATLSAGIVAVIVTFVFKTRHYWRAAEFESDPGDASFYNLFNLVAVLTGIVVPTVWVIICHASWLKNPDSQAGLYFAYRCLNPTSGVSPVLPILLLLLSWYLWAVFQTLRLRFSICSRPQLPGFVNGGTSYPLYVSDAALDECRHHTRGCLYRNITCLLITREVIERFFPSRKKLVDIVLALAYLTLFLVSFLTLPVHSMDRLLWGSGWAPTPFEFLIKALFFPLLIIALTGCLRMVFVWGALRRSLLQSLENLPIRFAFDRLKGAGWMTMFRQSGLREQWQDMARSTESMRQLLNNPELLRAYRNEVPAGTDPLNEIYDNLNLDIAGLIQHVGGNPMGENVPGLASTTGSPCDSPESSSDLDRRIGLRLVHAIEKHYASFAEALLAYVLIPYWRDKRTGMVECEEKFLTKNPGSAADSTTTSPPASVSENEVKSYISDAEEFLAIRYVSLIRAVLVNLRYLMTFISAAFALAIVAWNSYPFEPRQLVNWIFTILLLLLGLAIIWVFAQMHRDPILSRITDTTPNELGHDFYLRILSFGAAPVLTWLTYNSPAVGSVLFKLLQPGAEVIK